MTLYHAVGCHLCEVVREQLVALSGTADFELEEIDVDGVAELETAYRELLPVVAVDGEIAFVYTLERDAFLRRIAR